MKLLKKQSEYIVTYSKDRAINELKKDRRVKSVKWTGKQLVIETKPITPTTFLIKKLSIAPVGEYIIKIYYNAEVGCISSIIKRKQGIIFEGLYHPHITSDICWGNSGFEVDIIRYAKDWYWYAIRILGLLEDFADKAYNGMKAIELTVQAQIQYKKNANFTKKIEKMVLKYIDNNKKVYDSLIYFAFNNYDTNRRDKHRKFLDYYGVAWRHNEMEK